MIDSKLDKIEDDVKKDGYPKVILFAIKERNKLLKQIEDVSIQLQSLRQSEENYLRYMEEVFNHMESNDSRKYKKNYEYGVGFRFKFISSNTMYCISRNESARGGIKDRIIIRKETVETIKPKAVKPKKNND